MVTIRFQQGRGDGARPAHPIRVNDGDRGHNGFHYASAYPPADVFNEEIRTGESREVRLEAAPRCESAIKLIVQC
jgi:hypothetical protein